jgi:hypothetical protein
VYIAVAPDGAKALTGSTAESPKSSVVPGPVRAGAPGGTDTGTDVGNDDVPGADEGVDDEQAVAVAASAAAASAVPRMREHPREGDGADDVTCVR